MAYRESDSPSSGEAMVAAVFLEARGRVLVMVKQMPHLYLPARVTRHRTSTLEVKHVLFFLTEFSWFQKSNRDFHRQ